MEWLAWPNEGIIDNMRQFSALLLTLQGLLFLSLSQRNGQFYNFKEEKTMAKDAELS